MELEGRLVKVYPEQQISDSFKKREFVVEFAENPDYPQFVKFELTQDKVSLIESYQPGSKLHIDFNIRGVKYNDKKTGEERYFNSLQAWKLTPIEESGIPQGNPMPSMPAEDLPF